MGVLYVTYLLSNDSVYHLEEDTGEYQGITVHRMAWNVLMLQY